MTKCRLAPAIKHTCCKAGKTSLQYSGWSKASPRDMLAGRLSCQAPLTSMTPQLAALPCLTSVLQHSRNKRSVKQISVAASAYVLKLCIDTCILACLTTQRESLLRSNHNITATIAKCQDNSGTIPRLLIHKHTADANMPPDHHKHIETDTAHLQRKTKNGA